MKIWTSGLKLLLFYQKFKKSSKMSRTAEEISSKTAKNSINKQVPLQELYPATNRPWQTYPIRFVVKLNFLNGEKHGKSWRRAFFEGRKINSEKLQKQRYEKPEPLRNNIPWVSQVRILHFSGSSFPYIARKTDPFSRVQ